MGDDLVGGKPIVEAGFEGLDGYAGNLGAGHQTDQLLAFPGEHRATDDLDPPVVIPTKHHGEANGLR